MFEILRKTQFSENVIEYVISAPKVAKHAKAGQFVILRVDEEGERVPFTIVDYDRQNGTITLLIQSVGYTTKLMATKNVGDELHDFVGPLGKATDLSEFKNVMLVGGGIGTAVVAPQAKAMKESGKACSAIIGSRNKSLLVYEDVFKANCEKFYACTDDGSYGFKGFVTDKLREVLKEDKTIDCVFAVGPLVMMRAVCEVAKEFNVHSVVSMNTLMVDGTGMCGCCRVTVGGEIKYACVDGPEFDGDKVDFDEAINRSKTYVEHEKHVCNLTGEVR